MKKSADARRINASIPADAWQWIEARARYLGASVTAVVVMAIREKMEREGATGKDRASARAAE